MSCPVCQNSDHTKLVDINNVPVHCNVLLAGQDEALNAPVADISLVSCDHCSHIYNAKFEVEKTAYAPGYDASLFFSKSYQTYAQETAEHLVNRYELKQKKVLEIGCGDGRYLDLICRLGSNQGIGLDPGKENIEPSENQAIQFYSDIFDQSSTKYAPDFVICRHVLEHLEQPSNLVEDVNFVLSHQKDVTGGLYFEVPNANYTIDDLGIWDLIYEHYSYFTPKSLKWVFERAGFEINSLQSTYSNQFLCIEASCTGSEKPSGWEVPVAMNFAPSSEHLRAFTKEFTKKCEYWRSQLAQMSQKGESVALWGTGSKGVTFLNIVDPNNVITQVVDINPGKKGKYVPGTAHQVVMPEQLTSNPPDHVLVMNPVYLNEIEADLNSRDLFPSIHLV